MVAFLIEPLPLRGELGGDLAFLSKALTLLAGFLSLLLLLHDVVGRQFDLLETQGMERIADVHLHHSPELGDGRSDRFEPVLCRDHVSDTQRTNDVVRLGIVGAQHQLGEVVRHLAALGKGVVEGEHVRFLDGSVGLDELRDATRQSVESVPARDCVLKRMMVPIDADVLEDSFVVEHDYCAGVGACRVELGAKRCVLRFKKSDTEAHTGGIRCPGVRLRSRGRGGLSPRCLGIDGRSGDDGWVSLGGNP